MSKMREPRLYRLIEKGLNNLKLRAKILGLFLFCVMVPLVFIDGFIIQRMVAEDRAQDAYVNESMASAVENYFSNTIRNCQNIAISVGQNYNVGEVLGTHYNSAYDYYEQYHKMSDNYFFQTLVRFNSLQVKLYTSNDTVVGGGYVGRIDSIEDTEWYKAFKESDKDYMFLCDYDPDQVLYNGSKRRVFFVRKLNYNNNPYENFIRIDMEYGAVSRAIESMGHTKPIYIMDGSKLLFTNLGNNSLGEPYRSDMEFKETQYVKHVDNLGNITDIVVLSDGRQAVDFLVRNKIILLLVLAISVVLPVFVLYIIDHSIVNRIERLSEVFGKQIDDKLVMVDEPDGSDELGQLMLNYNRMVEEVNGLIQIVYKDRLREQEINIARQNAELLALQSQINPHFMFNALESIRMHSVIKGEGETAEMVEKLAVLERQYVDWGSDMIRISQEMTTVEAYLILQKYRFGDKLRYELEVDDDVKEQLIPKLTIVTFVENACVHGMENKTSECWVFVRIYRRDDFMIIEIEDTGKGIDAEKIDELNEISRTIELEDLKSVGHVGIYNALLRLKMTMGERYQFEAESEEGIGTLIQIRVPIDATYHIDDKEDMEAN